MKNSNEKDSNLEIIIELYERLINEKEEKSKHDLEANTLHWKNLYLRTFSNVEPLIEELLKSGFISDTSRNLLTKINEEFSSLKAKEKIC